MNKSKKVLKAEIYDCSSCGGSGLKNQKEVCPSCGGTGKAGSVASGFPEGTVLLRADGQYLVKDGKEVKVEA